MVRTFYLSLLFLFSFNLYAFDADDFRDGMSKKMATYKHFISRSETRNLFTEGKTSESTNRLTALVPKGEKTIFDFFILSNLLFQNDHKLSYDFMIKAEHEEPDNPYILFERGIHEHRLRNYSLAQAYYERFNDSGFSDSNPIASAYLTHTYLMTGHVKKAFTSWEKVHFSRNHTSIEKAMYTVFSDANLEHDRELLISEIKKGGAKLKLCDLYQLDSRWEIDWWNYETKETYLEYDIKLSTTTLKSGSIDKKYFQLCSASIDDQTYIKRLREVGLFSETGVLPESSSLIYDILKRIISTKSMTPEVFLNRFENQLVSLSNKHPYDRKYFDALAFLYAKTGNKDKLKSIDRYGWKELKIEQYALSFIAGIDRKSGAYTSILNEALEDFPLNPSLNKYLLSVKTQNREVALIKFVASQFKNVKNNWSGPHRLSDYMRSLRHELDKPQ